MSIPYIATPAGLTLYVDCLPKTIPSDHPNFTAIRDHLLARSDIDVIRPLLDIAGSISNFVQGAIEIKDNVLYFDGAPLNTGLARRVIALMNDAGIDAAQPLINFLTKLLNNPSRRAVQGLYEWLENSDLPITPDGCFIAWKIVGPDYVSLFPGLHRPDHTPDGRRIDIPRNEVNEDPNQVCSEGLRFCSSRYLPQYGTTYNNRVVVLKIDPADVVSFPRDAGVSKGRACGYWVIGEVRRDRAPTVFEDVSVFNGVQFDNDSTIENFGVFEAEYSFFVRNSAGLGFGFHVDRDVIDPFIGLNGLDNALISEDSKRLATPLVALTAGALHRLSQQ